MLPTGLSTELMNAIATALACRSVSPFRFMEARIISGEEEAIFGWLSLNYLLRDQNVADVSRGWLDLGGGSMQVAHEVVNDTTLTPKELKDSEQILALAEAPNPSNSHNGTTYRQQDLTMSPRSSPSHTVFRRSFLHYGRDQAFIRSCRILAHQALAQVGSSFMNAYEDDTNSKNHASSWAHKGSDSAVMNTASIHLSHPCLLAGDEFVYEWNDLMRSTPRMSLARGRRAIAGARIAHIRDLGMSNAASTTSTSTATPLIYVLGTSDAAACVQLISHVVAVDEGDCGAHNVRGFVASSPSDGTRRRLEEARDEGHASDPLSSTRGDARTGCDSAPHPLHFDGSFYGAGNYYYAALQLGLAHPEGLYHLSPRDYAEAASALCARNAASARALWLSWPLWSSSDHQARSSLEWEHARYACFSGLYISALLRNFFSLPPDDPRILVSRAVDGTLLDWTMGAFLQASNLAAAASADSHSSQVDDVPYPTSSSGCHLGAWSNSTASVGGTPGWPIAWAHGLLDTGTVLSKWAVRVCSQVKDVEVRNHDDVESGHMCLVMSTTIGAVLMFALLLCALSIAWRQQVSFSPMYDMHHPSLAAKASKCFPRECIPRRSPPLMQGNPRLRGVESHPAMTSACYHPVAADEKADEIEEEV